MGGITRRLADKGIKKYERGWKEKGRIAQNGGRMAAGSGRDVFRGGGGERRSVAHVPSDIEKKNQRGGERRKKGIGSRA